MTRVSVQDLVPDTDYAVQVRAVRGGQFSEWSERFLFTTIQNTAVPVAPGTVTWVVVNDGFAATWTEVNLDVSGNVAIIDSYELELTAGATTKIVVVPAQVGQDGNWALDFQRNVALFGTPQPSITLRVRAVNHKGIKGNWSGAIVATNPVPADVTGFSGTAGEDRVDLDWDANTDTDLDRYEIYTGTTAGFTPSSGNRIFSGNVTHFTYVTTTYVAQYFKIRAYDKFNQPSTNDASVGPLTPTSPFGADTTPPATPTGLSATITTNADASQTSAAVSWSANSETDLDGYYLRYRQNGTTPWSIVRYDAGTTSTVVTNLVPYINYDFQLSAVDSSGNQSAYTSTATGTGASNTAPSTPSAPTVSTSTMQAQVTVPGTKAGGGSMEPDVNYYEVYASTTTGFTPTSAEMLGTIPVGPAMIATFDIPASGGGSTQTWFFKIIAVDKGGLKSSASAQTSGTPGLIQGTNITNATITNAKIADLAADKITAGSGIINALSVKNTLTIGDATTAGAIQSFDWVSGATGWRISSNSSGISSFEVNQGTIKAAAVQLQMGQNIFHPAYADFEFGSGFYPSSWPVTSSTNFTAALSTTQVKYNSNSLKLTNTSGASRGAWMGQSNTDYNFIVEPSTTYIISLWVYNETAPTAPAFLVALKDQTATTFTSGLATLPATTGWFRQSFQVTTGASSSRAVLSVTLNNTSTVYIDGIQVEAKISGSTSPSPFNRPGSTTIDGYMIKTGAIVSNVTTTVDGNTIPVWSIPLSGSASFANLQVRGNAVVGVSGDDDGAASQIASGNYIAGSQGWVIRSDGFAEFRNVATDSLNGDAIRAGTLTIDQILGGSTDQVINLVDGSSLLATGLMGETVGLGNYGFEVHGPQQNTITNKASSGTTRTLTLASPHTFVVGDKINVIMGVASPNYDGTYLIDTVPTTTTLTYTASTSLTESTAAPAGSILQGANGNLGPGPLYVDFPTDGTQPNIISGVLTADTLTVTQGMFIRNASEIQQGAVLTIDSVIQSPTVKPTVSQGYNGTTIQGVTNIRDVVKTSSGTYIVLSGISNLYKVTEHDAAGNLLSTKLSRTTAGVPGAVAEAPRGLVYGVISGTGRWYLSTYVVTNTNDEQWVEVLDSSWAHVDYYKMYGSTAYSSVRIGWDYTNSRLMSSFFNISIDSHLVARHYTMTSGVPSAVATDVPLTASDISPVAFIGRGNFDFGVDRIVTKGQVTTYSVLWQVNQTTGPADSQRNWPVAGTTSIVGGCWDPTSTKFIDITPSGNIRIYEGGDSYWVSSSTTDRRYIRYTYYKSSGSVETGASPAAPYDISKRARLSVTIPTIPGGAGVNIPDSARVYLLDNATDTYPTVTNYYLRTTIPVGSTVGDIDPYTITTGTTLHTTNDFASLSGDPGQIKSSSGNSFWKGDDTAQFWKLVVNSSTDATTGAGNTPALRVGNITGQHLRVDGNEILAMSNDTTQGTLFLNLAGQTTAADFSVTGTIVGGPTFGAAPTFNSGFTSSGSTVFNGTNNDFPNINTTTNTANANFNTGSNNRLRLVTSLSKYKIQQKPITKEEAYGLLDLTPKTWYDKTEWIENGRKPEGLIRLPGLIAEDVEEHAKLFATYNGDKLNGVAYDRVAAGLIVIVRDHHARIAELEAEVASLKRLLG